MSVTKDFNKIIEKELTAFAKEICRLVYAEVIDTLNAVVTPPKVDRRTVAARKNLKKANAVRRAKYAASVAAAPVALPKVHVCPKGQKHYWDPATNDGVHKSKLSAYDSNITESICKWHKRGTTSTSAWRHKTNQTATTRNKQS